MYSEMQEQLRLSLAQFFGAILVNSKFKDPERKRQSLVALVIEELLKVCKTEDGQIDMITAKPIIKATHYLLENRIGDITKEMESNGIASEVIDDALEDLHWITGDLRKYLDTIE